MTTNHTQTARHSLTIEITCKFCGSKDVVKYGFKNKIQQYLCYNCHRKFNMKDTLENKKTPIVEVGTALSLYFSGLSLDKISEQLQSIYADSIDPSTIYHWITEYSRTAHDTLKNHKVKLGKIWVVDETAIEVGGKNIWFWDIIDDKTRFLIASHMSYSRTVGDAVTIMSRAYERSQSVPTFILSDKLPAYPRGIQEVFGKHADHIQSKGFTAEINTNLIERFHGTLKERTKVLRGFKTIETARIILDGFLVNYNFFRPHMDLEDTTPAKEAGVTLKYGNWEGFLRSLKKRGK